MKLKYLFILLLLAGILVACGGGGTEEAAEEFPRAVGADDFVCGAVIEIVGAFATLVGGPGGSDENILLADLYNGRAFMTDARNGSTIRARPGASRINASWLCCEILEILAERLD